MMSQSGERGAPAKSKQLFFLNFFFFFRMDARSLAAVTAAPSDSLLAGFIAMGELEEAEEGNCSMQ